MEKRRISMDAFRMYKNIFQVLLIGLLSLNRLLGDTYRVLYAPKINLVPMDLGLLEFHRNQVYSISSILDKRLPEKNMHSLDGVMIIQNELAKTNLDTVRLSVEFLKMGRHVKLNIFSELKADSILSLEGEKISDQRREHGCQGVFLNFEKQGRILCGHAVPCVIWLDGTLRGEFKWEKENRIIAIASKKWSNVAKPNQQGEVDVKVYDGFSNQILGFESSGLTQNLLAKGLNGIFIDAETKFRNLEIKAY
jgi:hypothetical protein